jgi:hypothetical protein
MQVRDLYFACVEQAAASGGTASKQCKAQRSAFEKECPKSWVRVSRANRALLATCRGGRRGWPPFWAEPDPGAAQPAAARHGLL